MNIHADVGALFAATKTLNDEVRSRRQRPAVTVSRAISFLAFAFERARNSIDYRDDHILRRASIARSLTRKFTLPAASRTQAERLVWELVLARYFSEGVIPHDLVLPLAQVLDKYKKVLAASRPNPDLRDWLTHLAAVEIDRILVPPYQDDALTNLIFSALEDSVTLAEVEESALKRLIYLAAARSAVGADRYLLSFLLVNALYPGWRKNDEQTINMVAQNLNPLYLQIEKELDHPAKESLLRFFNRKKAPFLILHDLAARKTAGQIQALSGDELVTTIGEFYQARLSQSRTRFNRLATRAIVSIFLTKMLILFILEIPLEKLFLGEVNLVTFLTNLALPPGILFLIVNTAAHPDQRNERRVVESALAIAETGKMGGEKFTFAPQATRAIFPVFGVALLVVLLSTFAFFLRVGFSLPSTIIMLLFLSLVIFFGFLIRGQARELMLEEKEGFLAPVVNFFSLPFIRAGRFLSGQLVRFNLLIFLIDVFLEAPFKAFFRIAQQAVTYIRERHEEAITQVP